MRYSGAEQSKSELQAELQEVCQKLQKAVDFFEHHKQFNDHNITNMWFEEVEYLSEKARNLIKRLGL